MASKQSAHIKKILAGDMAFTNVLVGILMILFESLWIVIFYDSGRIALGKSLGWDIQLISAAAITALTAPYISASLFIASSMTAQARAIVAVCSVVIGVAAGAFLTGLWLETGLQLQAGHAVSRLPWVLFGIFALVRLRLFKSRVGQGD